MCGALCDLLAAKGVGLGEVVCTSCVLLLSEPRETGWKQDRKARACWGWRVGPRPLLSGWLILYGGGGGVRGQKKVCVPKIDLQVRAPLINFIFS